MDKASMPKRGATWRDSWVFRGAVLHMDLLYTALTPRIITYYNTLYTISASNYPGGPMQRVLASSRLSLVWHLGSSRYPFYGDFLSISQLAWYRFLEHIWVNPLTFKQRWLDL